MNNTGAIIHLKTGNEYKYVCTLINATNANDGQKMVMYRNGDGEAFVREETEFWEKFKWKDPECCCCGTKENLYWDGPWYGYRCKGPDCIVF